MLTEAQLTNLLTEVRDRLNFIASDVFSNTGFAPVLVIYMPSDTFTQVMEASYLTTFGRLAKVTRELIEEQTFLGYRLIVTEEQDRSMPSYSICQIHFTQ